MISFYLASLLAAEHVADMLREAERERLRRAALGSDEPITGGRRPSLPPTPGPDAGARPRPNLRPHPVG